jgi:hypothetical protein
VGRAQSWRRYDLQFRIAVGETTSKARGSLTCLESDRKSTTSV